MVDRACDDPDADSAPKSLGLEAIYRAEGARVARWIERLDPHGDTEDLLHEVFLVVKRKLPGFRGESALTTWLHAITARVVMGARRRRRLRHVLLGREAPSLREDRRSPETPEEQLALHESGRLLYVLLERLSERDRTLLILHELEGLSGAALADVAGVSEKGVWVALHRARARLRKAYLAEHAEGPA